ncbi:acyltransferase family protein [Pontixanthobacter gangjinensis]|uniref:Acyltransferase family protein n=1 Tax=Pontixanthobacter gangjinensis TaxID=1028742 RepID=A0A6I4SML1_9SPHN|nr:acyltransferase family protein [Pontixanthobacter gangjinensis]MXO56057.1 acyltransferase family protein [Pontixanthobacter gangjinensis]
MSDPTKALGRPAYRPDIDGLRALAVVPVLLFHAHVAGFGGGFVGVDIFFVISGYLITGIIAREIDADNFSIIKFYERRARRILPALFAVVAFVLIAGSWLYLPGDFEGVPRSALAALGFLANVWFFMQAGYFQSSAETMPLLHTWSLGVEEQFYIVFPLILMLIAKFAPRLRLAAVVALAFLSFAWAVSKQADSDGFAFYLLPPRAWELMFGALLALGAIPQIRNQFARELLSFAGLAAIVASTLLYTKDTVFPGVTALPPVVGAALLIHCGPQTAVSKLLAMRAPVAIGLISYSLYLWHWPLIVLTEYAQDEKLSEVQSIVIVSLSFAIAWLSWRFIEGPFRNHSNFERRRIFAWSVGGMAALSAASLVLVSLGGWPARFTEQSVRYAEGVHDISPARDACLNDQIGGARPECNLGAEVAPTSLLWGDSHGVELAWVLGEQMKVKGRSLAQRTHASCPPALGYEAPSRKTCAEFNRAVMTELEANPDIKTVYLTAFWASDNYRNSRVASQLPQTIERLQQAGKSVILIGPVPPQGFQVPRRLAMRGPEIETASRASYLAKTNWLTRKFTAWQQTGVQIIDPADQLVQGETTIIVADGQPLYFDSHHLSVAGAKRVLAGGSQL